MLTQSQLGESFAHIYSISSGTEAKFRQRSSCRRCQRWGSSSSRRDVWPLTCRARVPKTEFATHPSTAAPRLVAGSHIADAQQHAIYTPFACENPLCYTIYISRALYYTVNFNLIHYSLRAGNQLYTLSFILYTWNNIFLNNNKLFIFFYKEKQ